MTREALESYILSTYNATSDFPWARYPSYEVFRHPANQKWFALLADIPASVFAGSTSVPSTHENREEKVCVLNVKCDPVLPFRSDPGIHPAYHMNKDKWISIEVTVVPEETIKLLLGMSFYATAPKVKRPKP